MTFYYAAENENLNNMEWLLENNFEHSKTTFEETKKMVIWKILNGYWKINLNIIIIHL
jgi:hypothetical protein